MKQVTSPYAKVRHVTSSYVQTHYIDKRGHEQEGFVGYGEVIHGTHNVQCWTMECAKDAKKTT